MDLLTAVGAAVAVLVCILTSLFLYLVVKIARAHSKYDHLPGPKRTRYENINQDVFVE